MSKLKFFPKLTTRSTSIFNFQYKPNINLTKFCSFSSNKTNETNTPQRIVLKQDLKDLVKKTPVQHTKVELLESDLEEQFVKGSGNGGQAINKTNSCVKLMHKPTGILIQCQDSRSQAENRKIARKLLIKKLDILINGKLSKIGKKVAKKVKQKNKQKKRAELKYGKKDDNLIDVVQDGIESEKVTNSIDDEIKKLD